MFRKLRFTNLFYRESEPRPSPLASTSLTVEPSRSSIKSDRMIANNHIDYYYEILEIIVPAWTLQVTLFTSLKMN